MRAIDRGLNAHLNNYFPGQKTRVLDKQAAVVDEVTQLMNLTQTSSRLLNNKTNTRLMLVSGMFKRTAGGSLGTRLRSAPEIMHGSVYRMVHDYRIPGMREKRGAISNAENE